ncbi:hypothetical protein N6B72_17380 [Chryseobacterium soli]|uniref:hypothetical protein n=1 Tax=Chryseobacterium soli TaxID=445961 RepID=UPI001AE59C99|nr:hypothetical protein [Chryseobacterium soli]MDV7698700.1 hypothetical protein [Chryseobacterium soli]
MKTDTEIKEKIQSLRKELTDLIINQFEPIRKQLDELLKLEAQRICPFNVGDIITIENGRKGKITDIDYHSLDYEFYINDENKNFYEDLKHKLDINEYKFVYRVDNKPFSITWKISGIKMRNKGLEVGKRKFNNITPVDYLVDENNKMIESKPPPKIMQIDMSFFEEI